MATRLYSLFEKVPNKHGREVWVKISGLALPLQVARRHWQNALLAPYLGGANHERSLRPVK